GAQVERQARRRRHPQSAPAAGELARLHFQRGEDPGESSGAVRPELRRAGVRPAGGSGRPQSFVQARGSAYDRRMRMPSRVRFSLLALFVALSLSGCTAEQVYGSGQAWQQNQCGQIPDKVEYDRCMSKASATYDSYKRQTEPEQK